MHTFSLELHIYLKSYFLGVRGGNPDYLQITANTVETKSPHILKINHEKSGNFYFWETTLSLVFRYPGICSHFLLPSGVFGWKTERQWLKPKVVFNGQNSRHFRRLVGSFFFSLQHFSDHLPRYGMYFMGQSCGQKYIFQAWTLSETLYKIVLGFICAFAHVSWWVS